MLLYFQFKSWKSNSVSDVYWVPLSKTLNPQLFHCSPLFLHNSGRVKCREEIPRWLIKVYIIIIIIMIVIGGNYSQQAVFQVIRHMTERKLSSRLNGAFKISSCTLEGSWSVWSKEQDPERLFIDTHLQLWKFAFDLALPRQSVWPAGQ